MDTVNNDIFSDKIAEILAIPGVSKKNLAGWADVDPSQVTRWCQRTTTPSDPTMILTRLEPHVARAREVAAASKRTEVDSWRPLMDGLDAGVRDYVEQAGLLASVYYVIISWIPGSIRDEQIDVSITRFYSGLWADMARRHYNLGDQSQIVSCEAPAVLQADSDGKPFDQPRTIGELAKIDIEIADEVGKAVARIRVGLDLEGLPYHNDSIGFVEGFGYGYRAKKAIATKPLGDKQTNDFLGAPIVIPCRRLNLFVCIPKEYHRGSPSALSSSNRSMLRVLMELDNAEPEDIEAMLWPRGRQFALSTDPDAPLKAIPRPAMLIGNMPLALQEALRGPVDLAKDEPSIADVLCLPDSSCFLLDVHQPHPSLTHNIIWRLPKS